jgi:flagellar biosynthesis/type III secretory pathway protein FliH
VGHYVGHVVKAAPPAPPVVADEVPEAAPDPAARVQAMLDEAELRAQQIIARAEAEAAALIARAREVGIADGKAAATMKFLELSESFQTETAEMEGDIAELVSRGIERIIALTPPKKKLEGVVHAAIRDLRDKRALVLHVAAEDAEFVTATVSHHQEGRIQPIRSVVVDDNLRAGECRLADGRSELRIDVDTQLAALRATLAERDNSASRAAAP